MLMDEALGLRELTPPPAPPAALSPLSPLSVLSPGGAGGEEGSGGAGDSRPMLGDVPGERWDARL